MRPTKVIKSSGEEEFYNRDKILSSLLRANISRQLANYIIKEAEKRFYDRITTSEIHSIITSLLRDKAFGLHIRYNLKKAFFKLGPTGYPFEKFVARVLKEYGYKTKVDVILKGRCVDHEIDVLAVKKGKFRLVECKFHNSAGIKTDVKVILYIKARFDDIVENSQNKDFSRKNLGGAWIFTNTKFTQDAIAFAECSSIRVTAWNYPQQNNIQKVVERKKLYPITIFDNIKPETLTQALEEGIVTLKDFLEKKDLAKKIFKQEYLKIKLESQGLLL